MRLAVSAHAKVQTHACGLGCSCDLIYTTQSHQIIMNINQYPCCVVVSLSTQIVVCVYVDRIMAVEH